MKLILLAFIFIAQPALASSPVWLVESTQNRLFLAGTIHLLRDSDYPLPAAFEAAYQQSQVLSFETDIGESETPAFQAQMMQALTLDTAKSLADFLSKKTFEKLEHYLQQNNLSTEHFLRFKPSMVSITLTIMELKKLGAGAHGVDQYYYNKAQQDKKLTLALETPQQQINFIANMGKGKEDIMIEQTLKDIDSLHTQFSDMVKSWRSGNTDKLDALLIKPMQQEFDDLYQQLLVQRNINWMPQISHYLKTPETEMVLVGTAHLLGNDGLIYKLKQAGYKITQLD